MAYTTKRELLKMLESFPEYAKIRLEIGDKVSTKNGEIQVDCVLTDGSVIWICDKNRIDN